MASVLKTAVGTAFVKGGKAILPTLKYDYAALEPAISGKIMELHHKNHHNTYVNSYNDAVAKYASAEAASDVSTKIALQPLINFHGGGHINHTLFWENLAPKQEGGGELPEGKLAEKIDETFGGFDKMQGKFNAALAGLQGSGWVWLVKENSTGNIGLKTQANQDPIVGDYTPLLGVDAWEHAYYLDYQNRKVEYFKAIWEVLNWKAAEQRFE